MKIKVHRYLKIFLVCLSFSLSIHNSFGQLLKSIVYDFDGLDINQTDLPEGDYSALDLSYKVAANPLPANDMIGDRVLKLNLVWNNGYGTFGRGISRFIEFNPNTDMFNFYFYNPVSNNQSATFDVVITDDDNQNNTYESDSDDTWKKSFTVAGSSGWQLFSVPLSSFTDSNTGGNGIFDIAFTNNAGMLLMVEFQFTKPAVGVSNPIFYLDMINFSDGNLPTGSTVFDLPPKNSADYCRLGAFQDNPRGQEYLIPSQVESLFPVVSGKKLKYANYFLDFAYDGTTVAKELPGVEVQNLITNGYRPIITWEPMFQGYDRLDPKQPRLNNIINGDYNSYIDQFADKIKSYTDTVIIRFMHEFEGNWYSWSLSQNGNDPALYVSAFRTVVDRFRARGASNVKWMWCVNSDYFPYQSYNWIVPAYPGDNYVDIIANDIYNNHYPTDLPWWRSFRWQMTESYYYLTKYFPQKPLYMCELGCRERKSTEDTTSESKGAWFARMDKELQSNYHKTRALIFFNAAPDQNWFINSSTSALQSLTDNIWGDDYYFGIANTNAPPAITTQPVNKTVSQGQSATFNVAASGAAPLTYQWQKNGVNISGANAASYTINSVQSADAGSYRAIVTNSFSNATSNAATLTVSATVTCTPPPAPTGANATICANKTANLSATGTGTLGWYSQAVAGNYLGGGANYTTPILTTNTTYYVQDSTCAVSSTRKAVLVTVLQTTTSSQTDTICAGQNLAVGTHTYSVSGTYLDTLTAVSTCDSIVTTHLTVSTATNCVPTTPIITLNGTTLTSSSTTGNQWYFNGNIITGATAQNYTATQNGNYIVKVNGSATSAPYSVTTTTGIVENSFASTINIYPNPFSSSTTIAFAQEQKKTTIKIMDVLGCEIRAIYFTGTQCVIEKGEMKEGIYFVQIIADRKIIVKKIILN